MITLYTDKDDFRKRILEVKKVMPARTWVHDLRRLCPGKYSTSEHLKRVQNLLNFKIWDEAILVDLEELIKMYSPENQQAA